MGPTWMEILYFVVGFFTGGNVTFALVGYLQGRRRSHTNICQGQYKPNRYDAEGTAATSRKGNRDE